tara:strand:+ start:18052 stop:19605 length:1554 start_codon:yes stop_codon:yes gene_type:complete
MHTESKQPEVSECHKSASKVECDLLVLFVASERGKELLPRLDEVSGGILIEAEKSGELDLNGQDPFFFNVSNSDWKPKRICVIGVGRLDAGLSERLHAGASIAGRLAAKKRLKKIAFLLFEEESCFTKDLPLRRTLVEGALDGWFEDRRLKRDFSNEIDNLVHFLIVCETADSYEEEIKEGVIVASSVSIARQLANTPGNLLTPKLFAEETVRIFDGSKVKIEILGEKKLNELNMGLLLGVSRGSVEPCCLMVMHYEPEGLEEEGDLLALVGKGVTFDSGGISIKPSTGMDEMKRDMAGGAAVIGAMKAIAALGVKKRVVGLVPAAENMPGGKAIKPGDVLTGASGVTVEIMNTDAEGRLILGDAIWHARGLGATRIVDIATLTGACLVALGRHASGLFGNSKEFINQIKSASRKANERLWDLPVYSEYRDQLRSEIADIANSAGRDGGASTAASFLQRFVEDDPGFGDLLDRCEPPDVHWAHIDIAGTAWSDSDSPRRVKGATGVMVRTLVELGKG